MPRARFLPADAALEVPAGTSLVDAARAAGVEIHIPCGGKGTCGKCRITLIAGTLKCRDEGATRSDGAYNACQCDIADADVVIEIPRQHSIAGDYLEDTAELQAILDAAREREPLARAYRLVVPAPKMDDGLSDIDRLVRALERESVQAPVTIPLPVIRELPDALRAGDFRVTALVTMHGGTARVIALSPSSSVNPTLGIAVDLGTTSLSVCLTDLASGGVLALATGYNGQIPCGLDVISRINYARTPERLDELRERALASINRLITMACDAVAAEPRDIAAAVVAGNTVMASLALGVTAEHLRLEPYAPAILSVPDLTGEETGITMHPRGLVHFSPAVGSYVGGDITAGLLMTELARGGDGLTLFIDIGTNGELVIGNDDFIMTCACSAGPAFEGGGISRGMRATAGAIDHVTVDAATGRADCTTIGGASPRGICGSGMIDLIAGLFRTGWCDPAGRLARDRASDSISIDGRRAEYLLAEDPATGDRITVTELDIENILRAKGAIYAACTLILEHAGLSFGDLTRVSVAGGFGRYLSIENAVTIGLLPDIPRDRFAYRGNTSLAGALLLLHSARHRSVQKDLAPRMTYVNLSSEAGYMDHYTAALFIPHTDTRLFPSVRR